MAKNPDSQFNIHPMDQFIIEPMFSGGAGLPWYSFTNQALWMLISFFAIGILLFLVPAKTK